MALDKTDYPLYLTRGETYQIKLSAKDNGVPIDLTNWTVRINFRNGQFLSHESPSDIINVDVADVLLTIPSDLVALLLAHKPNYEIVAINPAFPAGFGDKLLLAGRIKEA